MPWSETEVETILAEMRAGATVQSGGSRCHTTYYYRDGAFGYEEFDEGYTQDGPFSEALLRELIAREPQLFGPVLAAPRWRRFSAAFLAGERERARDHLRSIVELGDALDHCNVLDAVLAWPEASPSDAVAELVRGKLRDLTAYHVFMQAALWDRSPAVAGRGVELADTLMAMVGPVEGCFYLRSASHEQAGDLAAAERDMLEELTRTPAETWRHGMFAEQLERLRTRARELDDPR